jgi:hypothetical protein
MSKANDIAKGLAGGVTAGAAGGPVGMIVGGLGGLLSGLFGGGDSDEPEKQPTQIEMMPLDLSAPMVPGTQMQMPMGSAPPENLFRKLARQKAGQGF